MALRRQNRGAKGYLSETGRWGIRLLATPFRAWQPPAGDAIGGRQVSAAEVELGQDALQVILDGMLADHQTLGDLGVGHPRRYQLQHLHLSGRKLFFRLQWLGSSPNLFQNPGSQTARDRRLAPRQAPEVLQELLGPHVL